MRGRLGLRFVLVVWSAMVTATFGAVSTSCSPADPVSGICVEKYVEHGSDLEYTLVVRTESGEDHHFEVTENQFGKVTCKAEGGQSVRGKDLDVPND